MLLGVVSDIHCHDTNLAATLKVMDRMGVTRVLAAGDLVFEYRFSNEVVRLVRERDMVAIQGNHDMMLLGPHGVRARAAVGIDPREIDYLASLPYEVRTTIDGVRILLTHGSPWPPHDEYLYPGSPKLKNVDNLGVDLVIYGHTHAPLVERFGRTLVVNPGSLGMRGNAPVPYTFAVIETTAVTAEIHHVADPLATNRAFESE
jgi:putative phosphoesterase